MVGTLFTFSFHVDFIIVYNIVAYSSAMIIFLIDKKSKTSFAFLSILSIRKKVIDSPKHMMGFKHRIVGYILRRKI